MIGSIFEHLVQADELAAYSSHLKGTVNDGQSVEDPLEALFLHPIGEEVALLEVVILS